MRPLVPLAALLLVTAARADDADWPPNVVVIFTDDQGYQDLGCFGSPDIETPHIDRLAERGRRFTNFYAAQAVCSASRAALLTGCYPNRVGIAGALGPRSRIGLHDDELTLAELFKKHGYATGIFGKWHLGHQAKFLPTSHGFDQWFGLPYSNDMWPLHPDQVALPPAVAARKQLWPPLPLMKSDTAGEFDTVIAEVQPDDQKMLTTWYTEHAVEFIDAHAEEPFFLYVPHSMPHVPLYVSDKFAGKSGRGLYGDVIMEIDWSVGEIVQSLEEHGLTEDTLVVFTSDNGPWLSYGEHAGTCLPLREGKGTTWEGGQREPTVVCWPARIPAGTECDAVAGTIDLLPTVAAILGEKLPDDRVIDGRDILPLMTAESEESPHDAFYFYWGGELQAVRSGDWKLHFPHDYRSLLSSGGRGGKPAPYVDQRTDFALYNVARDPSERKNVLGRNPDVGDRLRKLAEQMRTSLGDTRLKMKGDEVREPGRL